MAERLASLPRRAKPRGRRSCYETAALTLLPRLCCWLLVFLAMSGCTTTAPVETRKTAHELKAQLDKDARILRSARPQLQALDSEFEALRQRGDWMQRGYFSADENDQMEHLVFRFTALHTTLVDIGRNYTGVQAASYEADVDAMAHVTARQAALLLLSHSAFIVVIFAEDPLAIAKMNEAFPRSEIPGDFYYRLQQQITAQRLTDLLQAGTASEQALSGNSTPLAQLAATNAQYSGFMAINRRLQRTAEARIRIALGRESPIAPRRVRTTEKFIETELYEARALLFKDVSRLKSPAAKIIQFTDAQKKQVLEELKPGDLILTYTAGYISDVFIPGTFKHGLTYVGSPAERRRAGVESAAFATEPVTEQRRLEEHIATATLANGKRADIIEAVAEGVILNSLEHLMATHINRLLVLRPRLADAEKAQFLTELFSYLGEDYDFYFDFADSSRQVCTELIYRGIQDKGGIRFDLTVRAGKETLSADDIVLYFLDTNPEAFDFVLLAREQPQDKSQQAQIFTGNSGKQQLLGLMQKKGHP